MNSAVYQRKDAFKWDIRQSVNPCYYEDPGIEMQAPVERTKRIRLGEANQATDLRLWLIAEQLSDRGTDSWADDRSNNIIA